MSNNRSEQEIVRFEKLEKLREGGFDFPNDAKPSINVSSLLAEGDRAEGEDSERFTLCGRMVQVRMMGKAALHCKLPTKQV